MDGCILRDNTGLKGEAATWAKDNLEPESFKKSDVSKYIDAISYEKGQEKTTFEQHLPGSDFVIQAIGYTRDPIPSLNTSAAKDITPFFEHDKGTFKYVQQSKSGLVGDLVPLPHVYGAGIAWPERVTDPYGNVELAVGFGKFQKAVKRWCPDWN